MPDYFLRCWGTKLRFLHRLQWPFSQLSHLFSPTVAVLLAKLGGWERQKMPRIAKRERTKVSASVVKATLGTFSCDSHGFPWKSGWGSVTTLDDKV